MKRYPLLLATLIVSMAASTAYSQTTNPLSTEVKTAYNNIKNWDYGGLMKVFNATDGEGLGLLATTGGELAAAIKKALDHTAGPTLIECTIDRNDCTKQLLEWGTRVATANARPQQRA